MKLVVQIPALNEAITIKEVIESIPRDISGIDEVDVVVVDDGSTDATADLAREAGAQVVRHEKPRGVGAAFRSGIDKSGTLGADIICTIDADMQFNPADIPKLVEPIARGEADFVTASRFKDPKLIPSMPKAKKWGNDFMARWISALTKKRFYDVSCGFRAYSRNAYLRLVLTGDFTYTHETFLCLAYAQVPMLEVPIKVRGEREHGESRVANNLFNYGWSTASIILKTYRDYRPLRFLAGSPRQAWCWA
jgi:glycosyltransferase involved in cell wall biosynthesis